MRLYESKIQRANHQSWISQPGIKVLLNKQVYFIKLLMDIQGRVESGQLNIVFYE